MKIQDRPFSRQLSVDCCPRLFFACCLWLTLASTVGSSVWLLAQSELATLTGSVADSSGGVIANAEVTVTNQGTNISSTGKAMKTAAMLFPA